MNAKNLPLKFAFVFVLVAICAASLALKGMRLGIDLRGGHSLTFQYEVREGEDAKYLGQEIINIVKKRIDPTGMLNLDWRLHGKNRIEVRMPAGTDEARQAKAAYSVALQRMKERNIQPSQLTRIARATDRQAEIDRLVATVGGGEQLGKELKELTSLYDAMIAARRAMNEATGDSRTLRQTEYYGARRKYNSQLDKITERNVRPGRLEDVLDSYVPRQVAHELKQTNSEELERRQESFSASVERLKQDHPARADEIQELVDLYTSWADKRTGLDDPSDLKRLIAKAGVLEFRIAPTDPAINQSFPLERERIEAYRDLLLEEGESITKKMLDRGDEYVWFPIKGSPSEFNGMVLGKDRDGKTYLLLYNHGENNTMTRGGWKLKSTRQTIDQQGLPAVGFEFDAAGAEQFGTLTAAHKPTDGRPGHNLAILLDDVAVSAPAIQSVITSQGTITGSFSQEEVRDLVRVLQSGSLPGRLDPNPVAENSFGPQLGEQNRNRGIRAAIIGLVAVALFMLGYYLFPGMLADLALVLNLVLVLGAMSMLNAVFTLPGIAGVILTIGIAVDANVLIFERLREEQAKGQSIRMALKNAYQKAFSAIFDANLTTMLTCVILAWVSTEEVKGFAITLGLGIVFSLFTALVVTRWLFQLLLDAKMITKPLGMMRIVGVPKINWMGKRKIFWVISAAMIVAGVSALIGQGGDVLGIEFSSGTQATIELKADALLADPASGEEVLPEDDLVRRKFQTTAEEMKQQGDTRLDKLIATANVYRQVDTTRVQTFLQNYDRSGDNLVTEEEWKQAGQDPAYFQELREQLDTDGDGQLAAPELDDLPSRTYQVVTTENKVEVIRDVMRKAFGEALDLRPEVSFDILTATDASAEALELRERLSFPLSASDTQRISGKLGEQAAAAGFNEVVDYEGGVMMVVRDLQPGLTRSDLLGRIRDIRFQPDFSNLQYNSLGVIPVPGTRVSDDPNSVDYDRFTAFVVLDQPGTPIDETRENAFAKFSERSRDSIVAALEREESLPILNYDPALAGEAVQKAVIAIILSCLAIVGYLWLRFGSIRWGLAAVICLVHDVVIVVGLVAVSDWIYNAFGGVLGIRSFKIDLAMVAAILTVIGYSVNDTIVVFDRIRENRGKLTVISPQILNESVNQTLARTLLTSTTTLIVVLIMYIAGGEGIRAFSFALLMGILFGTYSSVAIASPLLMGFRKALVAKAAPVAEPAS
jgi:SecD/SecF fusion protein